MHLYRPSPQDRTVWRWQKIVSQAGAPLLTATLQVTITGRDRVPGPVASDLVVSRRIMRDAYLA